jgi:hypothetical protein
MFAAEKAGAKNVEAWLSLVERCVRDAEAVCSNHIASTIKKPHQIAIFQLFDAVFLRKNVAF